MAIIACEKGINRGVNSRIIETSKFDVVCLIHIETRQLKIIEQIDFNRPETQSSNPKKGFIWSNLWLFGVIDC